ncbi:sensor histidine kinase [Vallitalea longa]|uniref:Sensor histidine kinase n=1 Tax=Vallitalea longa TaxID=2936439 RepID=A0A9W5YA30_9FIRM|nr:histidine kinase [Vallitalea longa]GKX29682.1 sensor histidine kinase [Vallitalea longa]
MNNNKSLKNNTKQSNIINTLNVYRNSLRYKILLLVALTALIPLTLFGVYLYSFVHNNISSQSINKELTKSIEQINDSIVLKIRMIDNTFTLLLSNQEIRNNLENILSNEQTYYLRALTQLNIETELKYCVLHDYAWSSELITSVFIFQSNENHYHLLRNYLPNDGIIEDHLDFINNRQIPITNGFSISPSQSFDTIYFMKDIETLISHHSLGKIVLGIDEHILNSTYKKIVSNPNWVSIIYDEAGTVYYHTNRNMIGSKIEPEINFINSNDTVKEIDYDDDKYFIITKNINDLGLTSVLMVPKTEISSKLNTILDKYLFTIFLTTIASIIIGIFLIINVTRPLKDIIKNIKKVSQSNFTLKIPEYDCMELNEISITVNDMIDKIKYLFNEIYQKQLLIKEAELQALQAQINPHFFFNVLETISWEALACKNQKIYKMINSLGKLIRANFTFSSREKIKISEELEYVKFYLHLQKMRFSDKIDIIVSIQDDSILDYYLPKLSIQTIVENAIIHGLENKIGSGTLVILIKKNKKELEFNIMDDGIGFDTSTIYIDKDNTSINSKRKHIGLKNVNTRLKLIYGNNYGISISSKIGKGTKVNINIPFDKGDNQHV